MSNSGLIPNLLIYPHLWRRNIVVTNQASGSLQIRNKKPPKHKTNKAKTQNQKQQTLNRPNKGTKSKQV